MPEHREDAEDDVPRECQFIAIRPLDPTAGELKYAVPLAEPRRRGTGARYDDHRRRARKDRDKILYSDAWRRLAGVTQVVSPDGESAVMHTRLTHSEKVAQVAWSMANHLLSDKSMAGYIAAGGGIDLDVVEAAALAHDLGHPPFGHIAEPILDAFARDLGLDEGFEGNAQSFRVVVNLVKWTPGAAPRGAALSRGSLAAILKYPWSREDTQRLALPGDGSPRPEAVEDDRARRAGEKDMAQEPTPETAPPKFGYYATERSHFGEARSWMPDGDGDRKYTQSLEASIMDLADDVTYAFHDFEDFVLSGAFDIQSLIEQARAYVSPDQSGVWFESLGAELEQKYPEFDAASFDKAVHNFYEILRGAAAFIERPGARREELSANTISGLLDSVIPSVRVLDEPAWPNGPLVQLGDHQWHMVAVMKAVTLKYIVLDPVIALHQRAQQRMLRELCAEMRRWAIDEPERLPSPLKEQMTYADLSRTLSPLTDAVRLKLVGPREDAIEADKRKRAQPDTASPERYLVDFIANLSDYEARALHRLLTGTDQAQVRRQVAYH